MAIYDINGNELATMGGEYGVIIPNSGIIQTCSDLYAKYDALVAAGFATRTLLATVRNLPMYRYDFSAVNKWATGGANAEDTSGNKLYTKKQVLFFSGIHGDEKGSPLYLEEFMEKVCYNSTYADILGIYDITVVPIGNPYGYEHNTRTNADNIDINRLDASSNTTEAQALMGVVDSKKWDLFIDFHNTDSDQANKNTGVTGAFAFANDMPSADKIKGYETYLTATLNITRDLRDFWSMPDNNGVQNFLPWNGTTNQTFRNYSYLHQSGGATVGATVSACFEVSRWCYTYSASTVQFNNKALIVGDTALNATVLEFLRRRAA